MFVIVRSLSSLRLRRADILDIGKSTLEVGELTVFEIILGETSVIPSANS